MALIKSWREPIPTAWFHRISFRWVAVLGLAVLALAIPNDVTIVAQTKNTKTLKVFSGRAVLTVPKTTKPLRKLYSNIYLAQPTNAKNKFALYVSRDPLGSDERTLSSKALGVQIKRLLEGQGYKVSRLKSQGLDFTADFTGFVQVPWQKIGNAPVRGTAKFTRTADKQLIGSILLCDPRQWQLAPVKAYKASVLSTKVSQR